jgi:uncharacterized protein (DUF1800 family)
MADVPVYRGNFGARQAERLLWRAGFGPRPGEAARLARRFNLNGAVHSLTRAKGKARLRGPEPVDEDGLPIAPYDAFGHDVFWWLDRMVRSTHPFEERMALIWHDWFATRDVDSARLAIAQIEMFRRRGLRSFLDLFRAVTIDPAMLIFQSGIDNTKEAPNENYAREMMELFSLGASNSKGYPYSEQDVRELARALTGWTADWQNDVGFVNFRFDPERHDPGSKRVFGKTGRWDWRDSCRLCVSHSAHAGYFVDRLWSYFIPKPPSARDRKALIRLYKSRKYAVRPVVEAILMHPALYHGPAMVKPPMVYIAGMLRARRQGVRVNWSWISEAAGQRVFSPPNVAGWDEERWMDTATFRGRWIAANAVAEVDALDPEVPYDEREGPNAAVRGALRYWGNPTISSSTRKALVRYASAVQSVATEDWQQSPYRAIRQNALRMMVATSPDFQTC